MSNSERLTDLVTLRTTASQRAFLEEYGYEKRLSLAGAVRDLIDRERRERAGGLMA